MDYTVVIVFDENEEKVLMCERAKEPFKGQRNFVGGKVEKGESLKQGAYRELYEETGISEDEIVLNALMDFHYAISGTNLAVFVGKLHQQVELIEEINHLIWVDTTENFFDTQRYAGEGNLGHMMLEAIGYRKELFQ